MARIVARREQIGNHPITPVVILGKHVSAQPERPEKRQKNQRQQRGQNYLSIQHVWKPGLESLSRSLLGASTISVIVTGIRRARLCQKMFYFVIVSLEWITHDEKIAAVASDRVPVDNIWEIAALEKGNCPRPT